MKNCRRSNGHFVFCNANPKGYVTQGDCATRALAVAFGIAWEDVVAEQCSNAIMTGFSIGGKDNLERLLEQHGFTKKPMPRHADRTLYTVEQYIKEMNKTDNLNPIVLSVPNHLTTIKRVRGKFKIHDTWDCGDKTVRQVYVKEA